MAESSDNAGNIIIGDGVSVKGIFVVPARAVVNGTIEGEITARELVIGQTGKIIGHARADKADVHGEVHETLVVNQSLILRSTGRIVGMVHYNELEIEKGGLIEGQLTQQSEAATRTGTPESMRFAANASSEYTKAGE